MPCVPYETILAKAKDLGLPTSYETDLTKWDHEILEKYTKECEEKGIPPEFAWAIRPSGTRIAMPEDFRNNPYRAKTYAHQEGCDYQWYIYDSRGELRAADKDAVGDFLYEKARGLGFTDLVQFNTTVTMPAFEELVGSIPEDRFEKTDKNDLESFYKTEINIMLGYARRYKSTKILMRRFDTYGTAEFCVINNDAPKGERAIVYEGGIHIDSVTGTVSTNH